MSHPNEPQVAAPFRLKADHGWIGWRRIAVVAGLVTLSCLVQFVLVRRATVPGLDAVRFVETARRIDAHGLLETIRREPEQPLFPAWVWLVHRALERTAGPFGSSWACGVQLAAAIPLVLAVVPVYFLSLRLVGPAPAAAGSLLFCLLPEVSRLGADGLSDSTHLFIFCLAFWAVVMYLGQGGWQRTRVQGSGFGVRGLGFRVRGSGFGVQGSGFRQRGSGLWSGRLKARGQNTAEKPDTQTRPSGAGKGQLAKPDPPLTTRHSPLTTHHSPLTTRHSPLATRHSPLTTHHSPLTTHHSPLTTHHSPLTTRHSPLATDHSPLTTSRPHPALWSGRNPMWLLAAGMLTGLAVLVRAEAVLLPAALVVALAAFQFQADRRQSWSRLALALGCLVLGCGAVFGPYLVAVGATTPRAAVARVLGCYHPEEVEPEPPASATAVIGPSRGDVWRLAGGEPMSFAPKETTSSLRRRGYTAATIQLTEETAEAFGYVIGLFALFGVWRLRRRLVRPIDRFAQIYCLLLLLVVLQFTAKEGYVSARHLVTLVVIGIGCAGYGALELGRRTVICKRAGRPNEAASAAGEPVDVSRSRLAWTLVLAAAAVCIVRLIEPLHVSRRGHRLAAEWLAEEADVPGAVLDTRGWTGLYSGRTTYRYDDARTAFGDPQLAYVVLERRELEYQSRRSRTLEHLLDLAAEPVASFPRPERAAPSQHVVVVYQWNAKRFARWVAGQSKGPPTREERHARSGAHVPRERI